MKRYNKIVLEAHEDVTFEVKKGTRQELIIKAYPNVYSKNYVNPPIPEGYVHIGGEWNNGFVIERCSDGSQFVWIPVGSLDPDGTLDGVSYTEKFGRRNYRTNFSKNKLHEPFTGELIMQYESVKKYGGFYISRYNISPKNMLPTQLTPGANLLPILRQAHQMELTSQSVKGATPYLNIPFDRAKQIAFLFENNETVKSHLTYGAEYDSILAWLIKSKAKTYREIVKDSTQWGNYQNTNHSPQAFVETGSNAEWCVNNIYDLAGNVCEWTQERKGTYDPYPGISYEHVFRGGSYQIDGNLGPVASRISLYRTLCTGFRIALYIK